MAGMNNHLIAASGDSTLEEGRQRDELCEARTNPCVFEWDGITRVMVDIKGLPVPGVCVRDEDAGPSVVVISPSEDWRCSAVPLETIWRDRWEISMHRAVGMVLDPDPLGICLE